MDPTCGLCQNTFEQPNRTAVTLSCNHSICLQCFNTLQKITSVLRCPNCTEVHADPAIDNDKNTGTLPPKSTYVSASHFDAMKKDTVIFVDTPTKKRMLVKFKRSATVAELKLLLEVKYLIDADYISFLGKRLEDDNKSLLDYNITTGSIIQVQGNEDVAKIVKPIAQGGFADVYLVKTKEKLLVLKKVNLNKLSDDKVRGLALQEMKLLEDLNHPNIVSYEGGFEKDQCLHMYMEYCSGGDLAKQIDLKKEEGGLFQEKKILSWIEKVAEALVYIHGRNILHRDVKPANIFLSSSGMVKLGDFGISRVLSDDTTKASTLIGTPKYTALEVMNNDGFTNKADMFSLGCCLFELAALQSNYPYMKVVLPESFSTRFKNLVCSLLDHLPENRPQAKEVLALPIFKKEVATKFNEEEHQESKTFYLTRLLEEKTLKLTWPIDTITKQVTPTNSEKKSQDLSAKSYLKILNSFCDEASKGKLPDQKKALDDIIFAMKTFEQNVDIQIMGSSSLAYIPAHNNSVLTPSVLDEITSLLTSALENHIDDHRVVILCCLRLHNFGKGYHLILRGETIVPRLLQLVEDTEGENEDDVFCFLALNVILMISSGPSSKIKLTIAQNGALEVLLKVIRNRKSHIHHKEMLTVCWSIITGLTAEGSLNCEVFIASKGLSVILYCLSMASDAADWEIGLWVTLSNVSKVKALRTHLMNPVILKILLDHLDPSVNMAEVSFEAAIVLVNILSEGDKAWTVTTPQRTIVIDKIFDAMAKWDLDAPPHYAFRILRPLWDLLQCDHTPLCQYWAVWTLAKLTRVQRDRYCPMVEEERGIQKLQHLVRSSSKFRYLSRGSVKKISASTHLTDSIVKLALKVIDTCENYSIYAGYETKNWDNLMKLFKAASDGNFEEVEEVIASEVNLNTKSFMSEHKGRSAIHLATEKGHTDIVCALIHDGASVHAKDAQGQTALHIAVWNGHLDLVRLLLIYGAEPTDQAKTNGWNSIHFAAASGHLDVLKILEEKCDTMILTRDERSVLHLAAEFGKEDTVSWLLEKNLDINLKDSNMLTAMDYATKNYHANVMKLLKAAVKPRY